MLDRFTGMQVLSRVAALGSFSAAARALGISQTMVTRHIDAIEDRLGARLFHRTTRRLTLTEAGQGYLQAAERILAEVDEAEGAASASVSEPRGHAPGQPAARLRRPGGGSGDRRFRQRATRRSPSTSASPTGSSTSSRKAGTSRSASAALRDSSLVARRLAPIRTVLCAAPAYLERHGAPQDRRRPRRPQLPRLHAADAGQRRPLALRPGRRDRGSGLGYGSAPTTATRSARRRLPGIGLIYQPTFLFSRRPP